MIHTRLRGLEGFWIEGSHTFDLQLDQAPETTQVTRNVLIWEENGLTYRLESDLSLDDALQIAESLR